MMDRQWVRGLALLLVTLTMPLAAAAAEDVPAHPSELKFGPLDFAVPRAETFRHELANGTPVYVVEDSALPLATLGVIVRVGSFLDPADQVGLAALTGSMLRRGGTEGKTPSEFDERADFLAANLGASIGETSGSASVNCLTRVWEECVDLFFEMMSRPRFAPERVALEKSNILERLKQRNDEPTDIARREWEWLMRGREHFSTRQVTGASLDAIGADDLRTFHRAFWRPERMIWTASGAVDAEQVVAQLDRHLDAWRPQGAAGEVPWPPPTVHHEVSPGVYSVDKDIPQGRVRIGHPTRQRESWLDPLERPASIMNDILGGGGFTARLTSRIRSDEGLAYSAGSGLSLGEFWPGTFTAFFQSKSETVAYAAELALEEIQRIRSELVSEQELETSKASFVETFPGFFDSARAVANLFANDEYLGRPHEYWYDYVERIRAVTRADVRRAAQELLHPERVVILAVGDWEAIAAGDADGRATMEQFYGLAPDGAVEHLPLRDPVTLEPMVAPPADSEER